METQANYSNLQLYIGIDVHKKQWSVSIFTDAAHHRTFSQPPSPEALKSYLDHHFPSSVFAESPARGLCAQLAQSNTPDYYQFFSALIGNFITQRPLAGDSAETRVFSPYS